MELCERHKTELAAQADEQNLDDERRQFAMDIILANFLDSIVSPMPNPPTPRQIVEATWEQADTCPVCWISDWCVCEIENCADTWVDQAVDLSAQTRAVEVVNE